MSRFRFEVNPISMRKFGLYKIAIVVTRKELKNFIASLKKMQMDPEEVVTVTQDRAPKSLTLRRSTRPRRKREWGVLKETEKGYAAKVFDDDLEVLLNFYVYWLNHGLPPFSGQDVGVKLDGEEIDLYFTQDAPDIMMQ